MNAIPEREEEERVHHITSDQEHDAYVDLAGEMGTMPSFEFLSNGVLVPDDTGVDCEDFTLHGERAWIKVSSLVVHIIRTDEGVVVDIYPAKHEDGEPVASTYAHFAEGEEDEEEADGNP